MLVVGVLAFLGVQFADTGHKLPSKFIAGQKPTLVPKPPKADPFTKVEQRQVRAVAVHFIETAVYRKHVDDSWVLTTATLHQGLTRKQWASGMIPVVPYPGESVQVVRWRIDYSYARRVGLKVAFYPKPGKKIERQIFDIELQEFGTPAEGRWLVSYWAPSGGPQIAASAPGALQQSTGPTKPAIQPIWLLVPVVLIAGSIFFLITFMVIRSRVHSSRAKRAYLKS